MQKVRSPALAISISVAVLLVAGCGDSGDIRSTSSNSNSVEPGGVVINVVDSGPQDTAYADTDRSFYVAAETGIATFQNAGGIPLFLPGCAPFVFLQRLDRIWTSVGPPFVCVWEGIAYAVDWGESDVFEFVVPSESGVYRLRYDYSSGCDFDVPLSEANCDNDLVVFSNIFEVVRELCDPTESGCQSVPGAPNILCADGRNFSGPAAECTLDPASGQCGYEFLSCP